MRQFRRIATGRDRNRATNRGRICGWRGAPCEDSAGVKSCATIGGVRMSLMNVVVGDGIGWLCVDTTSQNLAQGTYFQQSKMVQLAHHNAVIAIRGELSFLAHTFLNCFLAPADDFDALLESWPRRLTEATNNYIQQAQAMKFDAAALGHEVVLLGWSNARARPVCLAAHRKSTADAFDLSETNCRVAPDPGRSVTNLSSLAAMEALARDQVRMVRRENPDEPIGGRLLLAEVTCAGTMIRELAKLE